MKFANNTNKTDDGPRAYTVREACERLTISRSYFYALNKTGRIKTIKLGGRRIILIKEIERLLKEGCD